METVVASSADDMAGFPKPPLRRRRIIQRPRLIRAIDRSRAQVRMLVAGAGYGKTTLAEQWAAQEGRQVAWVRARRSSADVAVLARQMAAAGARIVPGSDRRLIERLNATADPSEEVSVLVDLLSEDLVPWPEGAWIVIDDYHHTRESAAAEAFVEGVVHQAPVNVLIATRERPSWVSMRSVLYGEVLEIGQSLLSMSEEEVGELLAGAHEELSQGLLALAGGWPAVVGLASLASHELPLPRDSVDIPDQLYAFFAEEVYRRLQSESRVALGVLATAPALDRELAAELLGGALAARVCAEAISIGVLEEREGRLELHPLASAFLQEQARRETDAEVQRTVQRCLDAYRRREEWDAAFELVERYGADDDFTTLFEVALEPLLNTGRLATVESLVARAKAREVSSARIEVANAELALREGKHLSAETFARAALAMSDEPTDVWRAAMLAGRAAHAGSREESSLELYRLAEQAATTDLERTEALCGQLSAASSLELDETSQLVERLSSLSSNTDPHVLVRTADKRLAADIRSDQLRSLDDARRVAELVDYLPDPFARCSFRSTFAYALNLNGRYEQAHAQASLLATDASQFRVELALPYAHTLLAGALAGLRRYSDAHLALDNAATEAVRCNDDNGLQNVYALRVRTLVQEGRAGEACALEPPDLKRALRGACGEVRASRALALASLGRFEEARLLGVEALEASKSMETRVLMAAVAAVSALKQRAPEMRQAVSELLRVGLQTGALDLVIAAYRGNGEVLEALLESDATREETVYLVARAGDEQLLEAGGWPRAIAPDPVERLSRREREVYELLCDGLSNAEIAKELFITEGTVKVHVQHVFDKLEIRSRTALAINAARGRRLRGT